MARTKRKKGKASSKKTASAAPASAPPSPPAGKRPRLWLYLVPPLVIAGAYLGVANILGWQTRDPDPISGTTAKATVDGDALSEAPQILASALGKTFDGPAVASPRFGEINHGLYVAFRSDGVSVGDGWRDGDTVREALAALARELAKRSAVKGADTAEICIAHSFRQVDGNRASTFSNIYRGVRGLEIETASGPRRISPTTMVAFNFSFERALGFLAKQEKMGVADISDENIRTFECDQLLVFLNEGRAVTMYRGNTVVPIASVNRESTAAFRDGLVSWLVTHVHPGGRMTYLWWPSQGNEAKSNNMIRQWMATAALGKAAADLKVPQIFDLVERNIDYNLAEFYRKDEFGNGYILWQGKAKLGAMALAAYAIYIHPKRAKWSAEEESILKTMYTLLEPSGRYTTFYIPPGRNDNENFYPGEAQLYLATRYADEKSPEMFERIMRAFRFYRQWHRSNRNPAFIPWHTQAYYTLWEVTKDQELVDFIFEMNDWLIETMQQWESAPTPDARGRFFKQGYGPPHASSTGVYLEGLIDAYKLARALGDERRRKRYARAMVRGLRSSMQLQFADDIDMFYIKKKTEAKGGMRTTVYDNSIRVDNVQHTLMGVLKIVREVDDEDWAYGITD